MGVWQRPAYAGALIRLCVLPLIVLAMAACSVTQRVPPLAGGDILYSTMPSPAFDFAKNNVCGGATYMSGTNPPWEWTPVLTPTDETSGTITMSGTVLSTQFSGQDQNADKNSYTVDMPFTHPWYNDWEYMVAVDPMYDSLLSPSNKPGTTDGEYKVAAALAVQRGAAGALGTEIDRDLFPAAYRPQPGDRIVQLGRWITDCGHGDFHSELHPPVIVASAHVLHGQTTVKVISNPFLVGQEFFNSCSGHLQDCGQPGCDKQTQQCDDGGTFTHLVNELKRIEGDQTACHYPHNYHVPCSTHVEVRPRLYSPPFGDNQVLSMFVIGPPPNTKTPRSKNLLLTYHLTARRGVKVVMVRNPDINNRDSVTVQIVMNHDEMTPAAPPARHDDNGTVLSVASAEAQQGAKTLTDLLKNGVGSITNDVAAMFAHTVPTDRYDPVVPPAIADCTNGVGAVDVDHIGTVQLSVNDNQPFPIVGCMSLRWDDAAL